METAQIHEAILARGAHPQALDALTGRVRERFPDREPKPAELTDFLRAVPAWELLGISEEAFMDYPAAWRLEQGHRFGASPPAVHARRPVYRTLTTEEVAALEGLPWAERRERARAMQQTPPPQS